MRLIIFVLALSFAGFQTALGQEWTVDEKRVLRSLWIGALEPLPPDPSNKYANNPSAAALGHKLFFDKRLSANGKVSCATCHNPDRVFTDGRVLAEGVGVTSRHTPTIVGAAYSPWFFWDGRKDSQWSQALGPLEATVEHGGARTQYVKLVLTEPSYRYAYTAVFGATPNAFDPETIPRHAMPAGDSLARAAWDAMSSDDRDVTARVFANIGKAITAYERRIMPGAARFDHYVAAVLKSGAAVASRILTSEEIAGLRLFIGRGNCTQCHNGSLFTNHEFHNTGVPVDEGKPDLGRKEGVQSAMRDSFNCLGRFSDAGKEDCGELKFVKSQGIELIGAFKTPTLRNVAETAPYTHNGGIATLNAVLNHYNHAPMAPAGQSELRPLHLDSREIAQLEQFLRTLTAPIHAPAKFLTAPQ